MKTDATLQNKSQEELIKLIQNQEKEITLLREKLHLSLAARYAKKSEKLDSDKQLSFFDEPETPNDAEEVEQAEEEITVPSHKRKKKGRKPLPDYLPRIQKIHDLPESEKTCQCGCQLTHISDEISEQLDYIPATTQVIQHVRKKYACQSCEETIKTAAAPKLPIPKSIASANLLAHVLVSKYADHLPLYRQEAILQRHDIGISRGTLANWVIKCAQLLEPLVKLMENAILTYDVSFADETTVQVLKEPDRPPDKKSYMWLFHGGPPEKHSYVYQYEQTRGQEIPLQFFDGYEGYLHIDGYAGYNALVKKDKVTAVGCLAHARRKFIEVTKLSKKAGLAHWAVKHIAKLYKIESLAKDKKLSHAEIYQLRQKKSKPLLNKLKQWLDENVNKAAPQSKLAVAMNYTLKQWPYLITYIDDGRLDIDNNSTERAIKSFATGRKNWLFSDKPEGANASAVIYSLMETCKAHDINPYHYFRVVLDKLPYAETLDDLEALLPYSLNTFE